MILNPLFLLKTIAIELVHKLVILYIEGSILFIAHMNTHNNKDHYIEIPLTFDPDNFREIYNELWKDEITRIDRHYLQRIYLSRILVTLFVFGFMMFFVQWIWALFIGLGVMLSVMQQMRLTKELRTMETALNAKRDEIEHWLDGFKQTSEFRLLLTPDHFTFFQDNTSHEIPWEHCASYETNENYVSIVGQGEGANFIFPRKAMNESDFFILVNTVEEKI